MATPEEIRAAVEAYVEGFNRGDREAVVALFAPEAELVDPVGTPAHHGPEGIRELWDQVRQITEDIELVHRDVVVCGHEAVMVFAIEARSGDAGMRMTAVDVFEFDEDAKISRLKAYWDMDQGQAL